jgi:hypothetical protein
MSADHNRGLVTRFITELWNDPTMAWIETPSAAGEILHDEYRPGYWRQLHWSWRPTAPARTAVEWLAAQVTPYRSEYPDFDIEIDEALAGGDHVACALTFKGTHATRTFTNRAGEQTPERRIVNGVSWSLIRDQRVARYGVFWDGGSFLGRDE